MSYTSSILSSDEQFIQILNKLDALMQIIYTSNLPEPIKLITSQLYIPLIKLSVKEPHILEMVDHPIHHLIEIILEGGQLWHEEAGREEGSIYFALLNMIISIHDHIDTNPNVIIESLVMIEHYIQTEKEKLRSNVKSAIASSDVSSPFEHEVQTLEVDTESLDDLSNDIQIPFLEDDNSTTQESNKVSKPPPALVLSLEDLAEPQAPPRHALNKHYKNSGNNNDVDKLTGADNDKDSRKISHDKIEEIHVGLPGAFNPSAPKNSRDVKQINPYEREKDQNKDSDKTNETNPNKLTFKTFEASQASILPESRIKKIGEEFELKCQELTKPVVVGTKIKYYTPDEEMIICVCSEIVVEHYYRFKDEKGKLVTEMTRNGLAMAIERQTVILLHN